MNIYVYRMIKKSQCTYFPYCNRQLHRDVLITLYMHIVPKYEILLFYLNYFRHVRCRLFFSLQTKFKDKVKFFVPFNTF